MRDRFSAGYDAGEEAGFDKGVDDGYSDGYDNGLVEGAEAAIAAATENDYFKAGYAAGVADAKRLPQATYQEGYDAGYRRCAQGYEEEGYNGA